MLLIVRYFLTIGADQEKSGHRTATAAPCSDQTCAAEAGLLGWPEPTNPGGGAGMQRQVDYYFSFQSPWAYIGHKPFREVVKTHGLRVTHKPVVLVDLFSETGGLPLM